MAMAREIPEESFQWRCTETAPSLAELTSRLAATSYRTLHSLKRERAIRPDELAKITDKEGLLEILGQSVAAVRLAVLETADEDLDLPIDHLGRRWSVRSLFLLLYAQLQEGLGQLAATATCAGIDPPWVKQRRAEQATED